MPLSTSIRIKLLKAVANHLSHEEWSLIDLTLSQFNLPTEDFWSDGTAEYVLAMTKHADDETLVSLAEHLGIPSELEKAANLHPSFWDATAYRLFITHLATHRKFAGELQESLNRFGISAFVAHNDIEPTKEWQTEIEIALSSCDGLVALLHPDFHISNWTDQEIGFAMGRGVPILTIGLGQVPYGFIGKFQAFNGMSKSASQLAVELFDTLRKHKQAKDKMSDVLVTLFEKSTSFEIAKTRVGYLEELEIWKPSYSNRIQKAVESNGQISEAWGVPSRVDHLLAKWKKQP